MSQALLSAKALKVWPIIFLPALLAFGLIFHFSVDVPFWDEWHVPGYIYERIIEGSLNYKDFFSQHNESRKLFPKLIFVAVGFTLGWHVTVFMVLSWFCVLLTFLILLKILQSITEAHPFMFPYIAFVLGALLFSTSQWENQLMGNSTNSSYTSFLSCTVQVVAIHTEILRPQNDVNCLGQVRRRCAA